MSNFLTNALIVVLALASVILICGGIIVFFDWWLERPERKAMKQQSKIELPPKPKSPPKPTHIYQVLFTDKNGTHTQTVVSSSDVLQVIKDIALYGGERPIQVLSVQILDDRLNQGPKEVDLI